MTFEQVVLLLTLLGEAIYITFEIAWTISNGKKKCPLMPSESKRSFFTTD